MFGWYVCMTKKTEFNLKTCMYMKHIIYRWWLLSKHHCRFDCGAIGVHDFMAFSLVGSALDELHLVFSGWCFLGTLHEGQCSLVFQCFHQKQEHYRLASWWCQDCEGETKDKFLNYMSSKRLREFQKPQKHHF